MTPQDFYRTQSPMSDPGQYKSLYDVLPDDLYSLRNVIQGIYLHYRAGPQMGFPISQERIVQADNRRMEAILASVVAQDDQPLTVERPPDKRAVGCCRDASLLLTSFLRHKGIPARIRYGFARYIKFAPGFAVDHVITEYWDEGRWKMADMDLSEGAAGYFGCDFDMFDIPRDQFLVSGQVWQAVRSGAADANNYGVHPDVPDPDLRGNAFIWGSLSKDVAFLNKEEYLLWDIWGMLEDEGFPNASHMDLLNQAADLSAQAHDDSHFEAIRALGQRVEFAIPDSVLCFSPVQPAYRVTV
jgi:hypothetical protein